MNGGWISKAFGRNWALLLHTLKELPLGRQLILSGIAVGAAAGTSAYVFETLIDWFFHLGFGHLQGLPAAARTVLLLALPALGGLIAGLLTRFYCPEARGHGVYEVVQAIRERGGNIDGRVVWAKTIASAATIGLGGSAGREGPVIQIGAAVGSWIGRLFRISIQDLKTLVAAGAVGGLAASFSIPLAGVFFTMEVILKDFANEAFPAVVIASVTGTVTARFLLGHEGFFTPLHYQWQGASDFFWYALLGIACAPLGILYMRGLKLTENAFSLETRIPDWLKPAVGGLMVGGIALILPGIMGTGQEIINGTLTGRSSLPVWSLIFLAFGKILATSLTLGSGGSGGVLMPAMFIGAMAGSAWGNALRRWGVLSCQPGSFAAVGIGCLFTSAFAAPVTAIVMTFEMTQDYGIVLPVMFACVITHLFSRRMGAAFDEGVKP